MIHRHGVIQIPRRIIGSTVDQIPRRRQCNCKRSNCLKLYCECYGAAIYCDTACKCVACLNNFEHEDVRRIATESTLERNPKAFRSKIQDSTGSSVGAAGVRHDKGCKCKKSNCLKKYCECFQANIYCSTRCRCILCKNVEGNAERDLIAYPPTDSSASSISLSQSSAEGDAGGWDVEGDRAADSASVGQNNTNSETRGTSLLTTRELTDNNAIPTAPPGSLSLALFTTPGLLASLKPGVEGGSEKEEVDLSDEGSDDEEEGLPQQSEEAQALRFGHGGSRGGGGGESGSSSRGVGASPHGGGWASSVSSSTSASSLSVQEKHLTAQAEANARKRPRPPVSRLSTFLEQGAMDVLCGKLVRAAGDAAGTFDREVATERQRAQQQQEEKQQQEEEEEEERQEGRGGDEDDERVPKGQRMGESGVGWIYQQQDGESGSSNSSSRSRSSDDSITTGTVSAHSPPSPTTAGLLCNEAFPPDFFRRPRLHLNPTSTVATSTTTTGVEGAAAGVEGEPLPPLGEISSPDHHPPRPPCLSPRPPDFPPLSPVVPGRQYQGGAIHFEDPGSAAESCNNATHSSSSTRDGHSSSEAQRLLAELRSRRQELAVLQHFSVFLHATATKITTKRAGLPPFV